MSRKKRRSAMPHPPKKTRRPGPYRRRIRRPVTANARWALGRHIGPLERLAGQTAAMIGAGISAGVTGRDALHAVIAAGVASTEDDAEAALAVRVIQDDLALLSAPTITRLYRQAGREGWRQHRERKTAQAAATQMLIDSLYGRQPGTLH